MTCDSVDHMDSLEVGHFKRVSVCVSECVCVSVSV